MRSRAEECLVDSVFKLLSSFHNSNNKVLNIGAGKSLVIERQLIERGIEVSFDRLDIEDCRVEHPSIEKCWVCSVEDMSQIPGAFYKIAFSNFVLEHVNDIKSAAKELYRILAPGGVFIASIPNPQALEFRIASHTPHWFHKIIRRSYAWHTFYHYKSPIHLIDIFMSEGFTRNNVHYFPAVQTYLHSYPLLNYLGIAYDKFTEAFGMKPLLGHACIEVIKDGED